MGYSIYGSESYPNDPRDAEDLPEIETAFCSYCGAEVPADEITVMFQYEKACSECLADIRMHDEINNEVTPIKTYKL